MNRKCAKCGRSFQTDRDYHRLCWSCYWEQRDRSEDESGWRKPPPGWESRTASTATPQLDVRFLRDAIQLCHPDRHPAERAETANAVTATLIELLQAQRRNGS